jgi:hypothetical protein
MLKKKKFSILVLAILVFAVPISGFGHHALNAEARGFFSDVDNHWAKDTIHWASERGIVSGYEDGTFKPNKQVTEAEFLTMLIRTYHPEIEASKEGHWADAYYGFAREMNYPVAGGNDLSLRNQPIIRLHVAELISASQGVNYHDNDAIRYLLANDLAKGNDPNNVTIAIFNPNGHLTRAEAVQFIKNVVERGKGELLPRPAEPSDPSVLPNIPFGNEEALNPVHLTLGVAYVNGESIGDVVEKDAMLFFPLKEVVEGMGDKFAWQSEPIFALVTQGDKKIYVSSAMSVAKVNNKDVPFATEEKNGVKVPVQVKPFVDSKKLYVPVDFVKDVLGYPVVVKKIGNTTYVFVGTLPEKMPTGEQVVPSPQPQKPEQQPQPQPGEKIEYDLPYKVPVGWVPPKIKSVATDDKKKNYEVLEKELGFLDGSAYNPYGGKQPELAKILISGGTENHIAQIQFTAWYGLKDKEHPSNKIPYVARELFKFYLPNDYNTLFTIIDDGVNGKDVSKYVGKPFTLDGREILIVDGERSITVVISKKGKSVD